MLVFVVLVMVVMVMFTGGLGFAGAAGELVHQLDELVRRGVVFAGHVAGVIEMVPSSSIVSSISAFMVRPPF